MFIVGILKNIENHKKKVKILIIPHNLEITAINTLLFISQ